MTGIHVEDLHFGYGGTPVLDGLSLSVDGESLLAVIGASGCGKSTLLRLVAGFEKPQSGTIRLGDEVVAGPGVHVPAERRHVGIVPQEGALFPHLSVADNIGFGLPRRSTGRKARVAELVALAGLEGLETRLPRELSGGQQQRVALARALAPCPRVVLLDEPFASLDAQTRVGVRTEVARMLRREGATGVLVTHDRAEALTMADEVAAMVAGRVAQTGAPFDLYDAPLDLAVARLLGEANVVPVLRREGDLVITPLGKLPVRSRAAGTETAADEDVRALVRPEQIRPDADGVRAEVTAVDFTGAGVEVTLAIDGVRALGAWTSRVRPTTGDVVTISVADGVHLVPA